MTSFNDLNLASAELESRASELGFSYAKPAFSLSLATAKDLKRLPSTGVNAVESTNSELLRAACKRDAGLLLVNPLKVPKFQKDDGLVRAVGEAARNAPLAFEIPVRAFLSSKFVYRAKLVSQVRAFLRLCLKFKAPFVFTSGAQTAFELKSPREVIAIGVFYGISPEQASAAISKTPQKLLEGLE
jgi:ribonuclease P/MRP protein subunit RPP1